MKNGLGSNQYQVYVILLFTNQQERAEPHGHLENGHMALSGLQIRGHAMFSHEGLPLDSETLEYAWLLELLVGDLTGRLTSPQLQNIVEFLQTFVFLIEDAENDLQRPSPHFVCQHGVLQPECKVEPQCSYPCPTADDIKYRMTRCSVDCVDLYLVEAGTALNVQVYPVRVSTCNLHGKNNKAGITALVPQINFKQFVLSIPVSQAMTDQSDHWLEAGGVCLGPINVDAAMALPRPEFHAMQDKFLKLHDKKTQRLVFMWLPDFSSPRPQLVEKCGCIGGCGFFGNNRNGPKFFQPSDRDYPDSINATVFHMCDGTSDFGYGQSILHDKQFVFEVHPSTVPVTPSKVHSRHQQRLDEDVTPTPSMTLVSGHQSGYISDVSLEGDDDEEEAEGGGIDVTLTRENVHKFQVKPKHATLPVQEQDVGSIPSDFLPDSAMPDAYDTDKYASTPSDAGNGWTSSMSGSLPSLPDVARNSKGHKRQHSYDALKASLPSPSESKPSEGGSLDSGSLQSPVFGFPWHNSQGSRGSIPSSSGASDIRSMSRHSSLTSPILRRLSSQLSVHREGSISSTAGSERYFSAADDPSGSEYEARLLHNLGQQTSSGSDQANQSLSNPSFGDFSWSSLPDDTISQTILEATALPGGVEPTFSAGSVSASSESTMSYISAVSSHPDAPPGMKPRKHDHIIHDDEVLLIDPDDQDANDNCMEADYLTSANIIDLHGQINQPITKSPLLMSCYLNHMTQLKCSHWTSPPPLPQGMSRPAKVHEDPSVASFTSRQSTSMSGDMSHGPVWIPQFQYSRQGFSPSVMVNKREPRTPPDLSSPASTSDRHDRTFFPESFEVLDSTSKCLDAFLHGCKLLHYVHIVHLM